MNHLQLITLTASFDFHWPEVVNKFFAVPGPAATVGDQLFSFDCFLVGEAGDVLTYLDPTKQYFRVFYVKLIIMALLPIILSIIVYSVWGIICCVKKDYSQLKTKAISSMVILLFLIHPNIVQTMFSHFQ